MPTPLRLITTCQYTVTPSLRLCHDLPRYHPPITNKGSVFCHAQLLRIPIIKRSSTSSRNFDGSIRTKCRKSSSLEFTHVLLILTLWRPSYNLRSQGFTHNLTLLLLWTSCAMARSCSVASLELSCVEEYAVYGEVIVPPWILSASSDLFSEAT